MQGSPLMSVPGLIGMCIGGFALGAGLAHLFCATHQPKGTRYGSQWHAFQHKLNNWTGQVSHIRLVAYCDKVEPIHIKAFGHVCDTCGYVNISRILPEDAHVEDEVCGRSTTGYTWSLL